MILSFWVECGSISETVAFVNYSRTVVVKVYHTLQNDTIEKMRNGTIVVLHKLFMKEGNGGCGGAFR